MFNPLIKNSDIHNYAYGFIFYNNDALKDNKNNKENKEEAMSNALKLYALFFLNLVILIIKIWIDMPIYVFALNILSIYLFYIFNNQMMLLDFILFSSLSFFLIKKNRDINIENILKYLSIIFLLAIFFINMIKNPNREEIIFSYNIFNMILILMTLSAGLMDSLSLTPYMFYILFLKTVILNLAVKYKKQIPLIPVEILLIILFYMGLLAANILLKPRFLETISQNSRVNNVVSILIDLLFSISIAFLIFKWLITKIIYIPIIIFIITFYLTRLTYIPKLINKGDNFFKIESSNLFALYISVFFIYYLTKIFFLLNQSLNNIIHQYLLIFISSFIFFLIGLRDIPTVFYETLKAKIIIEILILIMFIFLFLSLF
jgi:hypothetical protein